jgi:predicted ArsR family transcriptional regulator
MPRLWQNAAMKTSGISGKDTREKIVFLLKTRAPLSVEELATELATSGVNVRRYLEALERDGLVESTLKRRERGRPVHLYRLTERADELFPHAYDVLSVEILQQIEQRFGREVVTSILQGRADTLAAKIKPRLQGKTLRKRVEEFARAFEEMGYLVRVENGTPDSYVVVMHHCPVLLIARDFPEVCDGDCLIASQSLDAEVIRQCALSEGASSCRFIIRRPGAEA